MNTAEYSTRILEELGRSLGAVGPAADALADAVLGARRVYVAGAGRSGLMLRAFAMRLMHLGLTSYVVGESVTPAIGAGDLLLIGSGSGETESLCCMARRCRALGAQLAVVTTNPKSAIAALAETVVAVPAPAKDAGGTASIQPMGSLFEQTLLLLLDSTALTLMERMGLTGEQMYGRHANIE